MKTNISGFEFLPADASSNSIEVYPPFASLAKKHYSNKRLDISCLESGSIRISFDNMSEETKKALLCDIRTFLKDSRREVIDKFLIYKSTYL